MMTTISKIIFIIGAISAIGMVYLLIFEESSKMFYVLMLITLSTWPVAQFVSRRKKKDSDSI